MEEGLSMEKKCKAELLQVAVENGVPYSDENWRSEYVGGWGDLLMTAVDEDANIWKACFDNVVWVDGSGRAVGPGSGILTSRGVWEQEDSTIVLKTRHSIYRWRMLDERERELHAKEYAVAKARWWADAEGVNTR